MRDKPQERAPRRALLSVYDKRGIVDFGRALVDLGFELLSTGGTWKALTGAGVPATPIEEVTDFPEMLGGRVKSLHPRIHGGILARRHLRDDLAEVKRWSLPLIDVVAVNLYPFQEVAARGSVEWDELLENIDIGGPALVRAAAKNFPHVTVVVNPDRYPFVIAGLKGGRLSWEERRVLAQEAFAHTAAYDRAIARVLAYGPGRDEEEDGIQDLPEPRRSVDQPAPELPPRLTLRLRRRGDLRYGENPHQAAAFYTFDAAHLRGGPAPEPSWSTQTASLAAARQLQGKALSYNNINDAAAALELVAAFREPAAVAVKHANPCGVAVGPSLAEAFMGARDTDPVSIFGGIVALNRPVDAQVAKLLADIFLEVVIAPAFDGGAREILAERKNLRLLEVDGMGRQGSYWDIRSVRGGLLIQEADGLPSPVRKGRVVTSRSPRDEEWDDLEFAWQVVRFVKSNGIVVAKGGRTLGIGAGQMNRVQAARIALEQAGDAARGAVLASEAFFPFPDVVEAAREAGIAAIVQPGGALRDADSIAACDAGGLAMVFTGRRHFRH